MIYLILPSIILVLMYGAILVAIIIENENTNHKKMDYQKLYNKYYLKEVHNEQKEIKP